MSTQWGKNKATTKTEKYECTKKGNWERKCGKKKKRVPSEQKNEWKIKEMNTQCEMEFKYTQKGKIGRKPLKQSNISTPIKEN